MLGRGRARLGCGGVGGVWVSKDRVGMGWVGVG